MVAGVFLELPPAVTSLSETWLPNDHNAFLFSIPWYSETFSKCMGRGGGVTIQIRQDLVVVKTLPINLSLQR